MAQRSTSHRALQLAICILGIYVFFLTWGVLQERISTLDYALTPASKGSAGPGAFSHPVLAWLAHLSHALAAWKDAASISLVHALLHLFPSLSGLLAHEDSRNSMLAAAAGANANRNKFDYFIVLNLSQCLAATLIGMLLVWLLRPAAKKLPARHAANNPASHHGTSLKKAEKMHAGEAPAEAKGLQDPFPALSPNLLLAYLKIAISYCCASPFGYASLKHIDYVTMNLGKSCKLLPVLLLSLVVRKSHKGRAIESSKIIGVLLITLGVTGFMLFDEGKRSSKSSSALKLQQASLLAGSAAADSSTGQTASSFYAWLMQYASGFIAWFGSNSLYGVCLLFMNLVLDGATNTWQDEIFHHYKVSSLHMMFHMNWLASGLMLLYLACWPWTSELSSAALFLLRHPQALGDLILFALCGALGQAFVFYTIENFGALSLVTVTVTRKLFTILLSVIYFGHVLNLHQWLCVALVFGALVMETLISLRKHKKMTPSSSSSSTSFIKQPAAQTFNTNQVPLPRAPPLKSGTTTSHGVPPLTSSGASSGPFARATRQGPLRNNMEKHTLDATLSMPAHGTAIGLKKGLNN